MHSGIEGRRRDHDARLAGGKATVVLVSFLFPHLPFVLEALELAGERLHHAPEGKIDEQLLYQLSFLGQILDHGLTVGLRAVRHTMDPVGKIRA